MQMNFINRLLFNNAKIKTFHITRLSDNQVKEKVFLKKGKYLADITSNHGMICLDPFCIAAWLPRDQINLFDPGDVNVQFKNANKLNASLKACLLESIPAEHGVLLLYKIQNVNNYQLTILHRVVLFAYFLRAKTNTYYSRKVISALYSYPRKIIIVSYQDDSYCNIFPMDIQSYIEKDDLYLLGLRTTNITLNKILDAGKVVVCDTDAIDINTVYHLGKQSSKTPMRKDELTFTTTGSKIFGFPVPDFAASYKELNIIRHKKMGYHMLMVGKVVNAQKVRPESSSLYHVGFLQFQKGNYERIEGLF